MFFVFYILTDIIVYATEVIEGFSIFYDNMIMTVPTIRTLIFAGSLFFLTQLNQRLIDPGNWSRFLIALGVLILYMMFIPMAPNGALKSWCYYTPVQIFTFTLSLWSMVKIRNNPGKYQNPIYKKYRWFLLITAIMSVLIVVEDTIVIFNFDVYTESLISIQNRSITEDIMSICQAVIMIQLLGSRLINRLQCSRESSVNTMASPKDESAVPLTRPLKTEMDSISKFDRFCREYQLTTREQDILKLLLENKNNEEISDKLYISVGTTKTHIHNIFAKADVKKRVQLIELYQSYSKE